MTDWELLRAYVDEGSEEAFGELSRRYVDLVYSAAARQCGGGEQARDVSQAVFLTLARKAAGLREGVVLSGWLYKTARFVALEAGRQEARRRRRELAMDMEANESEGSAEELWREVAPRIDAAMEALGETDRTAVLLRFFQGRSLREVGESLGVSEEAAKKRVARSIEKLREILRREGVTSSSSLLGTALGAFAVQSAPASAAVVSVAGAASTNALANAALHTIAMAKMKTMVACATTALLTTGTVTLTVRHSALARENEALRSGASAPAAIAVAAGPSEAAELAEENRALQREVRALHALRSEVSQLRQAFGERPPPGSFQLWAAPARYRAAANTLRELQFEQFVAAGKKALAEQPLAETEQAEYVPEIVFLKELGLALRIYATRNGDTFPLSLEELMGSEFVSAETKEKLRSGRYEYHVYPNAEQKPGLPAAWWRSADERGIRMMVMNDGSSHLIREPAGVELPGTLQVGGGR